MTSSANYAAQLDAVNAQNVRIFGPPSSGDPWGGTAAQQFRFNPLRPLDGNLSIIASYVQADDVLIDVGGGAGRVSLPTAQRCREIVNVEPSPGMAEEFKASASEAGITNARLVQSNWLANSLEADTPMGEVVFTADVTYFVSDIVDFIKRLETAATRRVMVTVWSEPPPNRRAKVFELVYGEEQLIMPGHRDLLPVLWEMGILPDILVLPETPWWERQLPQTREEAVQMVLGDRWLRPEDRSRAKELIESRFAELFAPSESGFQPQWRSEMRELLITWETRD